MVQKKTKTSKNSFLTDGPTGTGSNRNARDPHDADARNIHILSGMVGQQINPDAFLGKNERSVIDAERGAAGREERVRRHDKHIRARPCLPCLSAAHQSHPSLTYQFAVSASPLSLV